MTLKELVSEEKRTKAQKTVIVLFISMMVGAAIWAVTHKGGFFLPVILLLFAFRIARTNSQNLKSIQAEISRKNAVG